MFNELTHAPLRYDPADEHTPDDEAKTIEGLTETLTHISETTFKDNGCPLRSVHAKSHALLEGELEVASGLHPALAQGLFAQPGRYPAILRFSTIPGDILHDDVSTPRGLAIKVMGVAGARLPGSEGDVNQDFVLVNGPAFNSPNAKVFLTNLKLLAGTTDKIEGVKKALSTVLQGVNAAVKAVAGEPNATIATLGGQAETHILGDSYFSQTAFRWGDYVAKIRVTPTSPELKALTDQHLKIKDPDALREACVEFFRTHGGEWEIQAQLRTQHHDMPIENAAKEWDQDQSPYLTVGRITVRPQTAWSKARSEAVDDGLSFSVWHGLAAHQPLGGVNRVRKPTYEAGKAFRNAHGDHVAEPREPVRLPA